MSTLPKQNQKALPLQQPNVPGMPTQDSFQTMPYPPGSERHTNQSYEAPTEKSIAQPPMDSRHTGSLGRTKETLGKPTEFA